jgi:excisionase family DNA binding protein
MALLTVAEAAERLGTTPRYVRRLIAEKRIEYVKLGGWHVRIEDAVIDEFIASWRVYPQNGPRPAFIR